MIKNTLLWLLCKINQPIISPSTGVCVSCHRSHKIEMSPEQQLEYVFSRSPALRELSKNLDDFMRADYDNEIEIPAERLEVLG